jgi:3D (Asp-Asp-Asp) domain-containing protein
MDKSNFAEPTLNKSTFVRANHRGSAAKFRAQRLKRQLEPGERALGLARLPRFFPVVHIPRRKDFSRYAVAYGRTRAMVREDSIIPFALGKRESGLKRVGSMAPTASKKTPPAAIPVTVAYQRQEEPLKVRTTAYTHNEKDHLQYGRKNAIGTRLRYGNVRSAAADWSRYPLGTQFRIAGQPGILYEVDDYGSALVGTGTIDLYKPTFSAMNRWGVRHVDIEVVKWGSFERSLKILKPRSKWRHVREMVQSIYQKGQTEAARIAVLPFHGRH